MTRFTPAQIDRLIFALTAGEDGHTEYAFDNPDTAGRYIVGGVRPAITLPAGVFADGRRVAANVALVRDWAAGARSADTIGFWIDKGSVFFDYGDTWTDLPAALQMAAQRGELAIWDRYTESEIRTA